MNLRVVFIKPLVRETSRWGCSEAQGGGKPSWLLGKLPQITQKEFSCLFSGKPWVLAMGSKAWYDPARVPSLSALPPNLSLAPSIPAHWSAHCSLSKAGTLSSLHCLFVLPGRLSTHISSWLILAPPWSFCSTLTFSKSLTLTTFLKWQWPPCLPHKQSRPYLFWLYFSIEMIGFSHTIYFYIYYIYYCLFYVAVMYPPQGQECFLFCFLMYPKQLEQFLAHSRN